MLPHHPNKIEQMKEQNYIGAARAAVNRHLGDVCDAGASAAEISSESYVLAFNAAIGAGATPMQARKIAEKISAEVSAKFG